MIKCNKETFGLRDGQVYIIICVQTRVVDEIYVVNARFREYFLTRNFIITLVELNFLNLVTAGCGQNKTWLNLLISV
jgi:hypothetical protein